MAITKLLHTIIIKKKRVDDYSHILKSLLRLHAIRMSQTVCCHYIAVDTLKVLA